LRDSTCKNGFYVTAICHGIEGGIPTCMNENVCARIYAATGGVPPVIANAIAAANKETK
jgi:drug/metabolite transporter superfamily protein YnfA